MAASPPGTKATVPIERQFPKHREERQMLKSFKNFLMRGDVIVVAVGLVVALAFSFIAVVYFVIDSPYKTIVARQV
jgi:hypothetical protein